jgi:hypothetical protein
LDEDYVGMEADAFEMLKLYHQDNHLYYFHQKAVTNVRQTISSGYLLTDNVIFLGEL